MHHNIFYGKKCQRRHQNSKSSCKDIPPKTSPPLVLVLATSLVSSPILTNVKFLENMEEIAAAVLRPLFTDHLGWCQLGQSGGQG